MQLYDVLASLQCLSRSTATTRVFAATGGPILGAGDGLALTFRLDGVGTFDADDTVYVSLSPETNLMKSDRPISTY